MSRTVLRTALCCAQLLGECCGECRAECNTGCCAVLCCAECCAAGNAASCAVLCCYYFYYYDYSCKWLSYSEVRYSTVKYFHKSMHCCYGNPYDELLLRYSSITEDGLQTRRERTAADSSRDHSASYIPHLQHSDSTEKTLIHAIVVQTIISPEGKQRPS